MRRSALLALALALSATSAPAIDVDLQEILGRGDSNNDGRVDISDAGFLCLYLFAGGQEPPCLNQADVDDNGRLDLSDVVYLNSWLFGGGEAEAPKDGPAQPPARPAAISTTSSSNSLRCPTSVRFITCRTS